MENVVTVLFHVESEAYQAVTELKSTPVTSGYTISQMALVKKQNGRIVPCDGFDTGVKTADDTASGMLIGGLVGILGGPLGMLFGASMGGLVGSAIDADEAAVDLTLVEKVSEKLLDGDVALIALVQGDNEAALDTKLNKFDTVIIRHDAAVVAAEVEEAQRLEREMKREARIKMRADKKAEHQQKVEEKRSEIKANFEAFKAKFRKD